MKKIISILLIFTFVAFSGFGCKEKPVAYSTSLEVWGLFDNSHEYSKSFQAYREAHPFVTGIDYKKFADEETYKKELLDYMAAGKGPDIFMIHNTWLPEFQDKIVPAPANLISEIEFKDNFVDVVVDDFYVDNKIYGAPLSVDSLALYYNKDIFNAAGIIDPPKTWAEVDDITQRLTSIDRYGNIEQSAIALGTYENINRSTDILTLMMMQLGTEMSNRSSQTATFDEPVSINGTVRSPARDALEYYTSFAKASQPIYTWNRTMHYSIDDFYEGDTAMMINYSWHYETIKAKNAKLNFAVSEVPQFSLKQTGGQVNHANYWVFVVAKNKEETVSNGLRITNDMRTSEAWQFLKALTFPTGNKSMNFYNVVSGQPFQLRFKDDLTEMYLNTEGKPAARKDLIKKQLNDVKLRPFASGNLIARSWYQENSKDVEKHLGEMIKDVQLGRSSIGEAIELAANRITRLMQ